MRSFRAIVRKELGMLLLSPVGYITAAIFWSASGWTFLHTARVQSGTTVQLEALQMVSVLVWLPVLITVVCMRLFSEEKRSGTIETLLTSPVKDVEVVLGKYCGALIYVILATIPAVSGIWLLARAAPGIEGVDPVAMLGGGLILVLITMSCTAIGLLVSLLTRNQIVAAICCFWAIWLPFMVKPLVQAVPFVRHQTLERLSVEEHVLQYTGGMIQLPLAVMYVSVTAFLLFAAVRILESRRWL